MKIQLVFLNVCMQRFADCVVYIDILLFLFKYRVG